MSDKRPVADWGMALENAREGLALLDGARSALTAMGDAATAEVSKYLRMGIGVDLNTEAIRATLTRPYTLVPINEHEAWLIHWRGVEMPIFGWVTKQESAFTIARITRTMDLLTPLPGWMRDELGWKPPAHGAVIDGTRTALSITAGDESSFKRRYGAHLGVRQADGSYRIKAGDAWIKLVAQLVRDGILPYTPQPVAVEHWNEHAESPITLRDYQSPALDTFREKGAVLINYPPGAGKTFIVLKILAHFVGRVLLLADTVILVEQWRDRLAKFAPNASVTVSAAAVVGARTAPYLRRMFRLCYSAPFAPGEIAEGLGITDVATVSRMRSACKALLSVGLFTGVASEDGVARFRVSADEIGRLRVLAKAVK